MEQVTDRGDGSHLIVEPLALPDGDTGVEQGAGQGEEHLDVVVNPVLIAARNELSVQEPAPGRLSPPSPAPQILKNSKVGLLYNNPQYACRNQIIPPRGKSNPPGCKAHPPLRRRMSREWLELYRL